MYTAIRSSASATKRAALVLLVVLAVGASTLAAQDSIPNTVLLKRLAEAVDGHRSGGTLYVVAGMDAPYPVVGVFGTQPDAMDLTRRLGPTRFHTYGPFRSIADPDVARVMFGCEHDGRFSMWVPPPSMCPPDRSSSFPFSDVDSMRIQVYVRGAAAPRILPVSPRADAVFFTLAAIDKFAIPYYAKILGVEAAAAMRADLFRPREGSGR